MANLEEARAAKTQLADAILASEEFPKGRTMRLGTAQRDGGSHYLVVHVQDSDMILEVRDFVEALHLTVEVDILLGDKIVAQLKD